ncbi:hypothetical protein GCM10020229_55340 [Kitasatospora albolonga]
MGTWCIPRHRAATAPQSLFLGRPEMETAGWVTTIVAGIAGSITVLGYLFDQVPPLSQKLVKAIRSVRALRDELRRTTNG